MRKRDRLMYGLSRVLYRVVPTYQRSIMRLWPTYRRRDDDLTERLWLGFLEGRTQTNAGVFYREQAMTTTLPGRVTMAFTTLEKD